MLYRVKGDAKFARARKSSWRMLARSSLGITYLFSFIGDIYRTYFFEATFLFGAVVRRSHFTNIIISFFFPQNFKKLHYTTIII